MHSSYPAAEPRTAPRKAVSRAKRFYFPPTQRPGLLDSTCVRSTDQRVNLKRSFENLLNALDMPTPRHATA